jgi:hypothetical protein
MGLENPRSNQRFIPCLPFRYLEALEQAIQVVAVAADAQNQPGRTKTKPFIHGVLSIDTASTPFTLALIDDRNQLLDIPSSSK